MKKQPITRKIFEKLIKGFFVTPFVVNVYTSMLPSNFQMDYIERQYDNHLK